MQARVANDDNRGGHRRPAGVVIFGAGAMLLACVLPALAAGPAFRILNSARQIVALSDSEAARANPVHLDRAWVTYFEPGSKRIFLLDGTGSMAADLEGQPAVAIRPGDVVTVDGETDAGVATPIIVHARVQMVGHGPLPVPQRVNPHALFSGDYHARWVSVEGIVKAVKASVPSGGSSGRPPEATFVLTSGGDQIDVATQLLPGENLRGLIDAKVRMSGVVCDRWNERRLLLGVQMYLPGLEYARVLENPPADPLGLPVRSVEEANHLKETESGHRVHVRGVVTSVWGDHNFSIMDSEHGIFVATEKAVGIRLGELLDVAGFPSVGEYTTYLDQAVIRIIGSGSVPVPIHVTQAEAFAGAHDAELIEIEGRLIYEAAGKDGIFTLLLSQNDRSFLVVLPSGFPVRILEKLTNGSVLRVRGICVIHTDSDHKPRDFNVLVRVPGDVEILHLPGWWTPGRVLTAAGLLVGIVLAAIVWNVVLRGRVRSQTKLIQAQLEEAQMLRQASEAAHQEKSVALANLMETQRELLTVQEKLQYQATHDSLTQLWNRAAMLAVLPAEMERAARTHGELGILLLDVDHFKRVNDTRGHLVGDAVLEEIGRRLKRSTRPYDLVGRYGGEEFLILLPGCGYEETLSSAERIRVAIAQYPFLPGESEISLTVSIGATLARESSATDAILLAQADRALYSAKSSGRNRIVVHQDQPVHA